MRVCDTGRIFPLTEWTGLAIDREPAGRGIAGGEVETRIGALLVRIICRPRLRRIAGYFVQAARRGTRADAGHLPRRVAVPVGLRDGAAIIPDQSAHIAATAHRTGGIGLRYVAETQAGDAAGIDRRRTHCTRRID